MKVEHVGSLPVVEEGRLMGIVTDRDIVIRAVAERRAPQAVKIDEVASCDLVTVEPEQDLDEALELMDGIRCGGCPSSIRGGSSGCSPKRTSRSWRRRRRSAGRSRRSPSRPRLSASSGRGHLRGLRQRVRQDVPGRGDEIHVFDSFECGIHALAPVCENCGCRVIGHGVEADGRVFCCAHCAGESDVVGLADRA
jgi:hypothetical protein